MEEGPTAPSGGILIATHHLFPVRHPSRSRPAGDMRRPYVIAGLHANHGLCAAHHRARVAENEQMVQRIDAWRHSYRERDSCKDRDKTA